MTNTGGLRTLLRDTRVQRLLVANTLGSIGAGVTIFAVPWLLVQRPEGSEAYRWATIATTLVLFVFMPYYGAWVDQHSRKDGVLGSELWGLFATVAMAALGLVLGGFATWQLVLTYFAGILYYTLHYPPKFAMVQQMFDRSHYQALIGLLEIQAQTAMMIAGGLGGWLVDRVALSSILLFSGFMFLLAFVIQATLPYVATHLAAPVAGPGGPFGSPGQRAARVSAWAAVGEGWRWLRARPRLALFFACSLMPFIIVMTANYLFPIYVAHTLQASAAWFAGGEIAFALGAIAAGALLPRLIGKHSAARTVPVTMLIFLAGLLVVIAFRFPTAYLLAGVLIGFGNAGSRVARSALLLHLVPNEVMGRVGGFYNVFDRVLRTVLVMSMGIIDWYGPPAGFGVLAVVLLLSLAGVMYSRRVLPGSGNVAEAGAAPEPAAAPAPRPAPAAARGIR
jgi:MFS family permease